MTPCDGYFIVSGTTPVVHSAIAFGSTTYLRFLEWVGGWFVYGHDISVIADRAIGGFFLVGWVLIAASIGVAYVTRGSQSVGGE